MPLIGYARVLTEDQPPLPQPQALKSAGCARIREAQASGGNRMRPVLSRVLERIGKGDTLVVVRIDRLARSVSHLLEVIERIDTASPQGKFTLQVLGAAAEFKRALIRERTKAGLASARAERRIGGNPGLRARDPEAMRKLRLARQDGFMTLLNETAQNCVPHVRRLRPDMASEYVLRIINAPPCPTPCWGGPTDAIGDDRLEAMRERAPPGADKLAAIIGQDAARPGQKAGTAGVALIYPCKSSILWSICKVCTHAEPLKPFVPP